MKIKPLGANQTEVSVGNKKIFVSYQTPVAAFVNGKAYRSAKKWSQTTSRHINQWLDGIDAEEKEQEFFDSLLK